MFSDLSSIILREIILRFDVYESIINFKLINKRLFKFIEHDIVIQRYYLKLRYNLIINDEDLFEYTKLLNSKSYSKFIKQRTFDKTKYCVFVNPKTDNFITWSVISQAPIFRLFLSCSLNIKEAIISLFENSTAENIQTNLFLQGYITLNPEISNSIKNEFKLCGFIESTKDWFSCQHLVTDDHGLLKGIVGIFDENMISYLKKKM